MQARRRYVDLVESVKGNGGQVCIFSSMHVSGERKDFGALSILFFTCLCMSVRAP